MIWLVTTCPNHCKAKNSENSDEQLWDSMVSFYTRLLYKIRDYKTRVDMSQAYKIGLSDDSNVTHYYNNTTGKAMPLLPIAPPGARTLPFDELLMQGMAIRGQHGQYVNCSQCRRMLAPGEGCAKCMTDPSNEAIYCLNDDFSLHPIFVALFYRPRKNWRTEPMSRPLIMATPQGLITSNIYSDSAYSTSIRLE
jgi:hypothetical protein